MSHNPFKVGDRVMALGRQAGLWAPTYDVFTVVSVNGVICTLDRFTEQGELCSTKRHWHCDNLRAAVKGVDYDVPQAVQPSGHLADGSSVQKHSAGPLYPYVLVYRDSKVAGRKYDVGVIGPAIMDIAWTSSFDDAVAVSESLSHRYWKEKS